MADKLLLRVSEAAERCSIGRSTAYELLASGQLPSVRVGRAVRVPVRALEAWIEEQGKKTTPASAMSGAVVEVAGGSSPTPRSA